MSSQRKHPSIVTVFFFILISSLFVISNWNHFTGAQLNLQTNRTYQSLGQQPFPKDFSFNINNMTFSHHMAGVNGIQIHYVVGGQGNPVVLLHGWPETWYEWRHVMPALAKNHTVLVPDLRGLGDSSKPITGYDGKTTAEDIYQLVSQLGFKDIFLVGHDFGVQVAYSYAAAHPDNVWLFLMFLFQV